MANNQSDALPHVVMDVITHEYYIITFISLKGGYIISSQMFWFRKTITLRTFLSSLNKPAQNNYYSTERRNIIRAVRSNDHFRISFSLPTF